MQKFENIDAPLRRFLTGEQDQTLLNLRRSPVPQKVKERAEVIMWELAAREEIDLQQNSSI